MKPYPEYKETGLSWLPKIPKHWDVVKIREIFSERKQRVSDEEYKPLSVCKVGIVPQLDGVAKTENGGNRKLVCVGDFVINSRSDRRSSSGISSYEGSVSLINIVLRPRISCKGFLHYLLKSELFVEEFYRNGRGIVADLWTTRLSEMKGISVPLPPANEQEKIVRYLDLMTAKIDKLIDAKKKQIALKIERLNSYLFSEKGATHLGWWETCFPSHWNLEKARRIFVERNQKGYSDRELLAVTQDQGILYKKDCPQHFVEPGDTKTQKLVCTGDCVISLRSFQGGVETSDFEGLVSAAYSVFYMKKTDLLLSNYYRYLFKTPAFIAYLNTLVRDIRDGKKIGFDDFRECFLPIPPAAHLEKIKGFVDEIEILKKSLYNEQKLLREYKDSLISSIVTGGLEVSLYKNWRSSLR